MNLAASLALCPLLCTPPIAGEGISSQTAQPITTPPKKDERAQSAFTFVDRSKLIPRGKISCSVRKELADGIEGADVHKLKTDLGEILNLLNEIEKQNEPFTLEKAIETGKIKSENALLIDSLPEVDRSKIAKGTESLPLEGSSRSCPLQHHRQEAGRGCPGTSLRAAGHYRLQFQPFPSSTLRKSSLRPSPSEERSPQES